MNQILRSDILRRFDAEAAVLQFQVDRVLIFVIDLLLALLLILNIKIVEMLYLAFFFVFPHLYKIIRPHISLPKVDMKDEQRV